eukprot:2403725-Alexandrium_andersonii.AAC.1
MTFSLVRRSRVAECPAVSEAADSRATPAAMSDIGETVPWEDVFDDLDAEMDYLMGLLEADSQEGQSGRREPADSVPEGAPDLIRA